MKCPECGREVALGWVNGTRVCVAGHRWVRGQEEVSVTLHPQNGRVPDRGLDRPFSNHRHPPVFVVEEGGEKHETPLCPEVKGRTHYALCREDALYAYGENWCEMCRMHDVGPGWKDPRYRREGSA